jgi:hypothetical protein
MEEAGVDTDTFGPHSVRSASTSAAKRGGAPIQDILDNAGWSSNSVFRKYYDKPLVMENVFADVILRNNNS